MKALSPPARRLASLSTFSLSFLVCLSTVTPSGGPGDAVLLADFDQPNFGTDNYADLGILRGFTASGLPFDLLAKSSGVLDKSFVLSDLSLPGQEEFGLETEFADPLQDGCIRTFFHVTPGQRNSALRFDWYEPFDRGADLLGIRFNPRAGIEVGDSPVSPTYQPQTTYLVGAELDLDGDELDYEVIVIDTHTDSVLGFWSGTLDRPVQSIGGAYWAKERANDGRFSLDNIEMTFLAD